MTVEFRRILVPVDFSPASRLALEYAKALAAKSGGVLELLHVVEDRVVAGLWPADMYAPSRQIEDALVKNAMERLAACLTREERRRLGVTLTLLLGRPAVTIVEHAASCKADLIVMGTHGRTGVSHLVLGSVAERVIRTAVCPVFVVRGETEATARALEPVAAAAI
jgi:nucleotide-binding universal stress UspA family protein